MIVSETCEVVDRLLGMLGELDEADAARLCPPLVGMPMRLLWPCWLSGARLVRRMVEQTAEPLRFSDDPMGLIGSSIVEVASQTAAGETRIAGKTGWLTDRASACGAAYAAELARQCLGVSG